MSEVTVTTISRIETDSQHGVEVWGDEIYVWIRQNGENVRIDPAAVPALIEALQIAAKEVGDE